MQYAVKELARRMSAPLEVDWAALKHLARYLSGPVYSRAVVVNAEERAIYQAGRPLPLTGFSDSDWAGCKETRRSTGCIQSNLASTVLSMSCQTQPGLPATSSSDAELREMSREARELYFLRQLIQGDFAILTEVPHLFSDSAVGIQVSRKLGPGNKLRHLEVFHFYVQELLRRGELKVYKVKGVTNPANYLTKHPSSVAAVQEALAPLGVINTDNVYMQNMIDSAAEIKVDKYKLGDKPLQATPWKPNTRSAGTVLQIAALGSMMIGAKSEQYPKDTADDNTSVLVLIMSAYVVIRMLADILALWQWYTARPQAALPTHVTVRPKPKPQVLTEVCQLPKGEVMHLRSDCHYISHSRHKIRYTICQACQRNFWQKKESTTNIGREK